MLISQQTQDHLESLVGVLASSMAILATGRELRGERSTISSAVSVMAMGKLTALEQSYVAGKIASYVGVDVIRTMTEEALKDWILANNFMLTPVDRANLEHLKESAESWIQGRGDAWKAKLRQVTSKANLAWKAAVETRNFTDNAQKAALRERALREYTDDLHEMMDAVDPEVDRLVQSEIVNFFQRGQVSGFISNELVYKVPRPTACKYCLELHLNADGSPKTYKLSEVLGSSNIGSAAYSWGFTIGPTHPHCYCVLYRTSEREPSPVQSLIAPRQAILSRRR